MFRFVKSSFTKIKNALKKTRSQLGLKLQALFSKPLDEETFDQLEQIFYEADLGVACAQEFTDVTKKFVRKNPDATFTEIIDHLKIHAENLLSITPPSYPETTPLVILIVGVNGSGKTTTIAKLAHRFKAEGNSVLLAAADTFRAAAIDQLTTWAERTGVDIVKGKQGADPSSIIYDALSSAKAKNSDIVLIDTAGRLQNKTELMTELEKIKKTCAKLIPDAPHRTLLILDATTGQNALDQARTFHSCTPLTSIALTKLDGSAKGGIILSIYKEMNIPVEWIGVGEQFDDLFPFDASSYADALFSVD